MLKVSVVGVTGYAGEVLIDLLLGHPQVRITDLSSRSIVKPKKISEIYPQFGGRLDLLCAPLDFKRITASSDLVFLALPHTVSLQIVPKLLKAKKKVIDLSADYRLKNVKVYKDFYGARHTDKRNLKYSVYGLPELYRNKIKSAKLLANPGCYPTGAILALAPLAALNKIDPDSVIIDAKSGVTGAGRKPADGLQFCEVNEDFRAYKVNVHQHSPEINQVLSRLAVKKLKVTFVPHLLPLNRGILQTIYVNKAQGAKRKAQNIVELYKKFYKNEPFVRIKPQGQFPRLKDVVGTNYCDIGIQDFGSRIIIISAIDNLLKGASGQAVQNMNIMYKFPETMGLI